MAITYWVSWSCEDNDFEAPYPTREERDARAVQLRAGEAEGNAELRRVAVTEPFAYGVETFEVVDQALAVDGFPEFAVECGFSHPREDDGAAAGTYLTKSKSTAIGVLSLDLSAVKPEEYEVWLLTHLEADSTPPVVHCTFRQGPYVRFSQVMTLTKAQDLVTVFGRTHK